MFWGQRGISAEKVRGQKALKGFQKWMLRHHPGLPIPNIEVVEWSSPSGFPQLPKGKKAIYSFHLKGTMTTVLKVGQAGGSTPHRYSYQHYRVDPQSSTLANSVLTSPDLTTAVLDTNSVGDWIRANTIRVDFLMPAETPIEIMNYLERYLFVEWSPRFEGRMSAS